jgi:hypothetical protein
MKHMIDPARDDEFGMTPLSLSIINATHKLPERRRVHWPLVISAMLALLLAMWWTNT